VCLLKWTADIYMCVYVIITISFLCVFVLHDMLYSGCEDKQNEKAAKLFCIRIQGFTLCSCYSCLLQSYGKLLFHVLYSYFCVFVWVKTCECVCMCGDLRKGFFCFIISFHSKEKIVLFFLMQNWRKMLPKAYSSMKQHFFRAQCWEMGRRIKLINVEARRQHQQCNGCDAKKFVEEYFIVKCEVKGVCMHADYNLYYMWNIFHVAKFIIIWYRGWKFVWWWIFFNFLMWSWKCFRYSFFFRSSVTFLNYVMSCVRNNLISISGIKVLLKIKIKTY
jgi:hypothetical protein